MLHAIIEKRNGRTYLHVSGNGGASYHTHHNKSTRTKCLAHIAKIGATLVEQWPIYEKAADPTSKTKAELVAALKKLKLSTRGSVTVLRRRLADAKASADVGGDPSVRRGPGGHDDGGDVAPGGE